jgi:hypothetical protein
MLDKLAKTSSLSGAFLVFCGVLKMIIYYSEFDVNIVDFLSFSEIITSFLYDLNILLAFAVIMLIVTFSTINFLRKKTNDAIEDFMKKLMNVIFPYRYRYVLFFSIVISILFLLLYTNNIGYNYFVVYTLIFCLIQTLTYILITKDELGEIDIPDFSYAISIAIVVTFAIFLFAKHDIQMVRNHKIFTTIKTQNETFLCDNTTNNLYLGKTDTFLFIKLASSNSTISIPLSEVQSIDFRKIDFAKH